MPPATPDLATVATVTPDEALTALRHALPHPELLRFDVLELVPLGLQPDRNLSLARLRVLVTAAEDPPRGAADSTVVDALHAIQVLGTTRLSAADDPRWWQVLARPPQAGFVVDLDIAALMPVRVVPLVQHPLEADLSELARTNPAVPTDQKE